MPSILITGASSGLGRALAVATAAAGVRLHLAGRDTARLARTAALCAAQGAEVTTADVDVRDVAAMTAWISGAGRLDLVIANAGISAGSENGGVESAAQTRKIFATNLDGALNTALPALGVMATQAPGPDGRRGTIAVIASIAGFVAAPGAPSYCASKAALDGWAVATAASAARASVHLVSVCPGYIRTPMTGANRFPMPGLMTPEDAAGRILAGLRGGRRRLVFPWWLGLAARLVGALPPRLTAALLAPAGGKASL